MIHKFQSVIWIPEILIQLSSRPYFAHPAFLFCIRTVPSNSDNSSRCNCLMHTRSYAFRKPVRPRRKNARGIQMSIVAPTVEDLLASVDETGGRGTEEGWKAPVEEGSVTCGAAILRYCIVRCRRDTSHHGPIVLARKAVQRASRG